MSDLDICVLLIKRGRIGKEEEIEGLALWSHEIGGEQDLWG